ncbi:hypothetical protein Taro_034653, partial [Colocasia esculenta]|nr:hypothetical protein [Colocasia esculenta]
RPKQVPLSETLPLGRRLITCCTPQPPPPPLPGRSPPPPPSSLQSSRSSAAAVCLLCCCSWGAWNCRSVVGWFFSSVSARWSIRSYRKEQTEVGGWGRRLVEEEEEEDEMGCLQSKTSNVQSPDQESLPADKPDLQNGEAAGGGATEDERLAVPAFREYGLTELRAATNDFSSKLIVSESGEKAPNVVYRGRLDASHLVAIKRFSRQAWPDAQQFVAEAAGVGKVRHKRLVNLIGCCAEGDERLLVAEYMPNDTLSKHLFHFVQLQVVDIEQIPMVHLMGIIGTF